MSGEVPRGSKLPTEKELAEQFGESKAVIRRALTRLRNDRDFHAVISEACRNALVKPMREVRSVAIGSFWFPWARVEIQVQIEMTRASVEEHARVYKAIKSGDPEAAEEAMRDHFAGSLQRYRERFGDANPCN
jgi:DNA-binding FadR family transcriptional regulator